MICVLEREGDPFFQEIMPLFWPVPASRLVLIAWLRKLLDDGELTDFFVHDCEPIKYSGAACARA
jgi:hypothetical protein